MKINLVSKNITINEEIKNYILKRVTRLGRLLEKIEKGGGEVKVNFEVSKNTKHHKSGAVFHSDCAISIDGRKFYFSSDRETLYETVDEVKENLFREIGKEKDKKQTLHRRGAKSVKKMMQGLSKRKP